MHSRKKVHGNNVDALGNKVHLQRIGKKVHESRKIGPQHPVCVLLICVGKPSILTTCFRITVGYNPVIIGYNAYTYL